eukprot:459330-Amphidinium_carterae.1
MATTGPRCSILRCLPMHAEAAEPLGNIMSQWWRFGHEEFAQPRPSLYGLQTRPSAKFLHVFTAPLVR